MSGVRVEVSSSKFSVAHECACCGAEPSVHLAASFTRQTGKKVIREHTRSLDFPYCERCHGHVTLYESAGEAATTTVVIGILAAIVLAFIAGAAAGMILFLCSLPIALVRAANRRTQAQLQCSSECAGAQAAVEYLGWSGTVSSFKFQSETYAVKFADDNSRNLVNVSMHLRNLLATQDPERVDRHAKKLSISAAATLVEGAQPPRPVSNPARDLQLVAKPAASSPALPIAKTGNDSDLALEWMARIESFKGSEARRNALKRGLSELSDPNARRDLMLAASRIEVAAVLDKVDERASDAAKRRHLEKAIAELRADDLPDALQADELKQLRDRLATLS